MTMVSLPSPFVRLSENELATQQRDEINHLLSRLFTSDYDGSLDVSRLCLLWKKYEHRSKEMVLGRLIDLGSGLNWFQSPNTAEYVVPVVVRDEDGDTDVLLAAKMGFLRLQGSKTSNSSTDEENAVLARHHKTLAEQTRQVEMIAPVAAQLAKFVALAIDLQATRNSYHNERLVMRSLPKPNTSC